MADSDSDSGAVSKQLENKLTLEEESARMRASRAGKMSHLTRRMNIVKTLTADKEFVDEVKQNTMKFNEMFSEFKSLQAAYIKTLSEEDREADIKNWYEPKVKEMNTFLSNVKKWVAAVEDPDTGSTVPIVAIDPISIPKLNTSVSDDDDNVSLTSSKGSQRSMASAARIVAEAERAALLAKAAKLQEKHTLEKEQEELRKRKETLEISTEIAANSAKINYLQKAECSVDLLENYAEEEQSDAMNEYCDKAREKGSRLDESSGPYVRPKQGVQVQFSTFKGGYDAQPSVFTSGFDQQHYLEPHAFMQTTQSSAYPNQTNSQETSQASDQAGGQDRHNGSAPLPNLYQESANLSRILTRQNELTNILVKQQVLSTLPQGTLSPFDGDIFQYKSFIHSFEHTIERKTDDNQDRLQFLIQYTKGQAQELVRSCQHMNPNRGYRKAKALLREHFGNEYRISCAYMEKALSWPSIKSEDSKALSNFALFLRTCCNAMEELEYMEELDTIANMKNIVLKLPYKLREKWRAKACELQRTGRVRMVSLVSFIERQASVMSDPIYGNIQDLNSVKIKPKLMLKPKPKGTFATNLNVKAHQESRNQDRIPDNSCLFCKEDHELKSCIEFEKRVHKEKITFLRQNGICFGCLVKAGHVSKDCTGRLNCSICKKGHPSVLHIKSQQSLVKAPISSAQVSLRGGEHSGAGDKHNTNECMLSIVPVKVKHSKGSKVIHTYAFLDSGSSATFCTKSLIDKLKITGRKTNILLRTMSQEKSVSSDIITGLEVSAINQNTFIALPEVYTQRSLPVDTNSIPTNEDLSRFTYLREVNILRIKADVELLIGSNVPKALEPWEVVNSEGDGPYAVKTILGWTVNGPLYGNGKAKYAHMTVNRTSIGNLEELLMQQYSHDFNESQDKVEMSQEDKKFMTIAEESVKLLNGHYTLDLPFRRKDVIMPDNHHVAEQRLSSLKKKFQKNEKFKAEYTEFLTEVINRGHAEVVPQDELKRCDGKVWYIPHHGVYHTKKGTIRVVFDCGATYRGTSLNSELLQGPDLTSSLFGVLTRFRQEPVAVMTDIQTMFHQVKVSRNDIDFLRFLWWPNGNINKPPGEHRMLVHLFGAVSSPSCANFALRQTAKDNKNMFHPNIISTVENNFYVDDCLKSLSSEQEAVQLVRELTSLCQKGGFRLTKWVSNSRTVLMHIPKEDRAREVRELDLDRDKLPVERALGLLWSVENDQFKFNITVKEKPHTRRNMLSIVSSIYDPLGFLCPLTLSAKLLLQELCRNKHDWDSRIPQAASDKWSRWINDLCVLESFEVPRCVKPSGFGAVKRAELHHFSDASDHGYGTVSYLRMTADNHAINVSFMLGKARVAPLKQMTIPRMELAAAVLAVKVDKMLRKEVDFKLCQSTFWTDSQSVLKYIANEQTRFHTFVANRISVIRDNTDIYQWRYIGTKLNPADMASRGMSANTLVKCKEWIQGPEFLWKTEEEWPQNSVDSLSLSLEDPEVKRSTAVCSVVTKGEIKENPTSQLLEYFSSWQKLQRTVAWYLKFKDILKSLRAKRNDIVASLETKSETRIQSKLIRDQMQSFKKTLGRCSISLEDLSNAEKAIIVFCQRQRYSDEMEQLQKASFIGKALKRQSNIYKLDPVLDEGVLRVGGRLSQSAMPDEAKRPMIMPKDHYICTLLLRHIHEKLGHAGRNHILSTLRQKYWIVNANSATRKVLTRCVICRRTRGKVGEQKMADLPKERLRADLPPFSNVGVDYFGPFEVKRGRSLVKRYGVLFTCMSSRAIHLEMAHSMDTDSCLNALRRFVSRRGQVTHIRSDNGTNLVGARNELQKAISEWNHNMIQKEMFQKGVQWSLNPPAASHHGGVWERLIRMVRQVLYSILKEQELDDEGLETLLCEVEAILNSRPITTVTEDNQDLEALTPNHILLLKTHPVFPPGLFQRSDLYVRRRWKQVQYLAELFWKRWTREYLPLLQERQKWLTVKRGFQKGDVVMVVDSTAPRGSWPLGRVLQVHPGSQGLTRTVTLQTRSGILIRPISKLYMLLEASEFPE